MGQDCSSRAEVCAFSTWFAAASTCPLLFCLILPSGRSSGVLEIRNVTGSTELVFSLRTGDCWWVSPPCCTVPGQGPEYGRPVLMARFWAPISSNSCWPVLLYLSSLTGTGFSCSFCFLWKCRLLISLLLYVACRNDPQYNPEHKSSQSIAFPRLIYLG